MFRGATLVNLDSKGRLSVPTRYRDQLLESATWYQQVKEDIDAEQSVTGALSERLQDLSL